jgi:threonine aldolase
VDLDPAAVETNILIFRTPGRRAAEVAAELAARGVLAIAAGAEQVRFTTHRDVDDEQVELALDAVRAVFESSKE